MVWKIFEYLPKFRENPKEGHEDLFNFKQGVIAERRWSEGLVDLASVGEQNLQTLERITQIAQQFEERDQVVAAAARAYRDGLASLIATPLSHYPADAEARREAMQNPFENSTASQPSSINGPSESSRAALPDQSHPQPQPNDQGQPPRRGPGRPRGSLNKSKARPQGGHEA